MIEVLSKENMKISDKIKCVEVTSKKLMYDAGYAIYNSYNWHGRVLIICGSGNNAGDGYVLASLLLKDNIDVTLYLTTDKFSNDGKNYYSISFDNHNDKDEECTASFYEFKKTIKLNN